MKTRIVIAISLLLLCLTHLAHAQNPTTQTTRPPSQPKGASDDALFLSESDIPRVQRVLPGLIEASRKGRSETQAFLARQEISFSDLTQLLSNISVAYSSIKFDEYLKEIQPQLDAKPGEYHRMIEQSRRQLDEITAPHQRAKKGGRSALQVNREIVSRNLAAVEEIIVQVREVAVSSLPQS